MKIVDESILFFSKVSLSKFSLKLSTFHGYKSLSIVGCVWNVKSQFCNKQGVLTTLPRNLTKSQV